MIPHTLHGLSFVERFYSYPEIESTDGAGKSLASKPRHGFFVIQADKIISRSTDKLHSLYKNSGVLAVSIVCIPNGKSISHLNAAISLAVCGALNELDDFTPIQVRMPSDILCKDKKLGEIQIEKHPVFPDALIISFKVYVNHGADEIPAELKNEITSLRIETGILYSQSNLLRRIIVLFNDNIKTDDNSKNAKHHDLLDKAEAAVMTGELESDPESPFSKNYQRSDVSGKNKIIVTREGSAVPDGEL